MKLHKGSWAHAAMETIQIVLLEARNEGLSPKDTIKAVDAAYPFGERSYHPYKMWLKVRRELCQGLPGVKPIAIKTGPGIPDDIFKDTDKEQTR